MTDEDLQVDFCEENIEYLRIAEEIFLDGENSSQMRNQEQYMRVYRTIHAIKGGALVLKRRDIVLAANRIEGAIVAKKYFSSWKEKDFNDVFKYIDILKKILKGEKTEQVVQLDFSVNDREILPSLPQISSTQSNGAGSLCDSDRIIGRRSLDTLSRCLKLLFYCYGSISQNKDHISKQKAHYLKLEIFNILSQKQNLQQSLSDNEDFSPKIA